VGASSDSCRNDSTPFAIAPTLIGFAVGGLFTETLCPNVSTQNIIFNNNHSVYKKSRKIGTIIEAIGNDYVTEISFSVNYKTLQKKPTD